MEHGYATGWVAQRGNYFRVAQRIITFSSIAILKLRHVAARHLFVCCALTISAVSHNALAAEELSLPPDVRLVIDISGSMKQNDPNNLRQPAVDLLVKLLPDNSKSGIWTFGQYVNMLVPHRVVDEAWRKNASAKSADITSTGLLTNIGAALEKAAYDAANSTANSKYKTSIILLTDGMVDISTEEEANQVEWRRIVDDVLPKLKAASYTIHTIALSDNADTSLLNRLATATDGIAEVAHGPEELMTIFLRIFDNAAPAEQVPLEGNAFVVDSSVEEFTALIFRNPTAVATVLTSPDNKRYEYGVDASNVSWYQSAQYDLITVQKPVEGEWRIRADIQPDSRVTVVSNLNLFVKPLKNNIAVGDSLALSMLLSENGQTVTNREFLQLIDIDYQLTRLSDQETWQGRLSTETPPANGIYTHTLAQFDQSSDYQLTLSVDGKSFKREFSHTVAVRNPFTVNLEQKIEGASTHFLITASSASDGIDHSATKVVAQIRDPSGVTRIVPLVLTDFDNWLLDFVPEEEGVFTVALQISAVNTQGGNFEYSPEPFTLRYPSLDDPFGAPVVEEAAENVEPVVAEPEAEPIPEPEVQPEPEPVIEETPEPPVQVAPEDDNKMWMYIGLGLGNLFILGIAYIAYRIFLGQKTTEEVDELDTVVAQAKSQMAPAGEAEAVPSMSDMAALQDDGDDLDGEDHKIASELMANDLDISSEKEEPQADPEDAPPLDPGVEEKELEDLGVTDVEFSLDDFSSDDMDELEDDDK